MRTSQSARNRALKIIEKLRSRTRGMPKPASDQIVERYGKDPYLILINCLLSLRARDAVSLPISCLLFERAHHVSASHDVRLLSSSPRLRRACSPEALLSIPLPDLERLLRPIGFYRQKARQIRSVSAELIARFGGAVPRTKEELLSIKGIGPKTANLVLAQAFDVPAICVDTHVHRLANHLGLVTTKTVEQTERDLMELLPRRVWREINRLLVTWGQNVCKPRTKCQSVFALEGLRRTQCLLND